MTMEVSPRETNHGSRALTRFGGPFLDRKLRKTHPNNADNETASCFHFLARENNMLLSSTKNGERQREQ